MPVVTDKPPSKEVPPDDADEQTSISISKACYAALYQRKGPWDTWEDVLWRLLDEERPAEPEPPTDSTDLHPAVAALDPPGTIEQQAARLEAAQAAINLLQREGSLRAREIYRPVHAEHPAGYDGPRSLWKNWLLPALGELAEAIPDLSAPDTNHDTWDWNE